MSNATNAPTTDVPAVNVPIADTQDAASQSIAGLPTFDLDPANAPEFTCNINRVAPPHRVVIKIRDELQSPTTVIIFGVDKHTLRFVCEFYGLTGSSFCNYSTLNHMERLSECTGPCGVPRKVNIIDATGGMCGTADERRQIIEAVREAGAATVVGIYIESSDPNQPHDWLKDAPCAEEFDYLVVVHGKDVSHTLPSRQE